MKKLLLIAAMGFLMPVFGQEKNPKIPILFVTNKANEGLESRPENTLKKKQELKYQVDPQGQMFTSITCSMLDSLMVIVPPAYSTMSVKTLGVSMDDINILKYLNKEATDNQEGEANKKYAVIKLLNILANAQEMDRADAKEIYCGMLQSSAGIDLIFSGKGVVDSIVLKAGKFENRENLDPDARPMIKIDPRRYVTVYEKNKEGIEPIWWLKAADDNVFKKKYPEDKSQGKPKKLVPHQEYEVLDENVVLEIRFDQEMLADNLEFYGNVSLAAKLDNEPIAVAPYSLVGEERTKYGVKNEPISEISAHFLNLFIEAQNAWESRLQKEIPMVDDTLKYWPDQLKLITELLFKQKEKRWNHEDKIPLSHLEGKPRGKVKNTKIRDLISEKKADLKISKYSIQDIEVSVSANGNKDDTIFIESLKRDRERYNSAYLDMELEDIRYYASFLLEVLKDGKPDSQSRKTLTNLTDLYPSTEGLSDSLDSAYRDLLGTAIDTSMLRSRGNRRLNTFGVTDQAGFNKYLYEVGLVIHYMEYFSKGGGDAIRAFLTLAEMTEIRFNAALSALKHNYKILVELPRLSTIPSGHENWWKYSAACGAINSELGYIALRNRKFLRPNERPSNLDRDGLEVYREVVPGINFTSSELSKLRIERSYEGGQALPFESIPNKMNYKKTPELVHELLKNNYAFYQKSMAKAAGKIIFNKLLYATIDLQKANAQPGQVLEVFVVWKNIDDTVEEDEHMLPAGKFFIRKTGWHLAVSESAFLVQRINEDLVTNDVSPSNFKPTAGVSLLWSYYNDFRGEKCLGRFGRWLEPSFGINVSYADFTTTKDYEIAVGPVVGLWNNRVFLTGGYNFNVRGQSPFYVGFGLSFSNIVNNIETQK